MLRIVILATLVADLTIIVYIGDSSLRYHFVYR